MKVKLLKHFNGNIDGAQHSYPEGAELTGRAAEFIAALQPSWVEVDPDEKEGEDLRGFNLQHDKQLKKEHGYTKAQLLRMTKDKLIALAEKHGVKAGWEQTKDQIAEELTRGRD